MVNWNVGGNDKKLTAVSAFFKELHFDIKSMAVGLYYSVTDSQ